MSKPCLSLVVRDRDTDLTDYIYIHLHMRRCDVATYKILKRNFRNASGSPRPVMTSSCSTSRTGSTSGEEADGRGAVGSGVFSAGSGGEARER